MPEPETTVDTTAQGHTDAAATTETPVTEEDGKPDEKVGFPNLEDKGSETDEKGETDEGETEDPAPESKVPEKYELNLEEGYTMTEDQTKAFTDIARETGLSNEAANKLIAFDTARQKADNEAHKVEKEKGLTGWDTDVKKKYGTGYPAAYNKVQNAFQKLVPVNLQNTFISTGFIRNPDLFDFLHGLGGIIGEDTIDQGGAGGVDTTKRTLEDFFKKKKT